MNAQLTSYVLMGTLLLFGLFVVIMLVVFLRVFFAQRKANKQILPMGEVEQSESISLPMGKVVKEKSKFDLDALEYKLSDDDSATVMEGLDQIRSGDKGKRIKKSIKRRR